MVGRRKWLLIAVPLALLAACVGVWNWSERSPYRFLDDASLIQSHRGASSTVRWTYASSRPVYAVFAEAKRELPGPYKIAYIPSRDGETILAAFGKRIQLSVTRRHGPPSGPTTVVEIERPITFADGLRLWLAGFHNPGNAP